MEWNGVEWNGRTKDNSGKQGQNLKRFNYSLQIRKKWKKWKKTKKWKMKTKKKKTCNQICCFLFLFSFSFFFFFFFSIQYWRIENGKGTQTSVLVVFNATSAMCVQDFDDSRDSAIHMTYRSLLRSSSTREPRDPLLKVVLVMFW